MNNPPTFSVLPLYMGGSKEGRDEMMPFRAISLFDILQQRSDWNM